MDNMLGSITMADTKIIKVISSRKGEAFKALEKLARKAARYGNPDITVKVGETTMEDRWVQDWDAKERKVKTSVTELIVTGDAPKVGQHEFLSRIELSQDGAMLWTRPGVKDLDPRFRQADGHCDHCNSKRRRNEVFVVRDTVTGEQMQVGRSCLRVFMGIDSPTAVTARFNFWKALESEESYGGGAWVWCQSLEALLSMAAVSIRLFGWCSKGQAMVDDRLTPTASYVHLGLADRSRVNKYELETWTKIREAHGQEDDDLAQEVITWVRSMDEASSDYMHNMKVAFAQDAVTDPRRVGLIVSAVSSFLRAKEREVRLTAERTKAKTSKHVGDQGERLRGLSVVKTDSRVVGGSSFGECVLIKFTDDDGNVFTWFTGAGTGVQTGERCTIDGTVKRHTEYNGSKETQLSRVAVKAA